MSHTLAQPDEIELALMEEEIANNVHASTSDQSQLNSFTRKALIDGYVSPYRAAYMQSTATGQSCMRNQP